jgi:hypothetical protein
MALVLERGDISFFYRPRVQPAGGPFAAPATTSGVQSFFAVLSAADKHRRLRVGKKRMPASSGERLWARIERVGSLQHVLADQLEAEEYPTRTRGDRYQPGAQPIAQGAYAFVRHDDHVHLAYRIDRPESDVPDELRVPEVSSHLVLFERVPAGHAVWTTIGDPSLLDEEGAEIVLVGAEDALERELGIDVLPAPPAP